MRRRRWGRWALGGVLGVAASSLIGWYAFRAHIYASLGPPARVSGPAPEGVGSYSAASCGACHQEIYAEWKASGMGRAFSSEVFQADWEHFDQAFFCLGCHAPLDRQAPEKVHGLASIRGLVPDSTPNPDFDAQLQAEGVTCVVCHLRDGKILGVDGGGKPPHPVIVDPRISAEAACRDCHQLEPPFFADVERPLADTHREWEQWRQRTGRSDTCVDCHMPMVERLVATGGRVRPHRSHGFRGTRDPDFLRSGLDVRLAEWQGSLVVLEVENLAGHRFPSADPSRELEIRASLLDEEGRELERRVHALRRRVIIAELHELDDNTLEPAETRRLRFEFGPESAAGARSVQVELFLHRLVHHALADRAPFDAPAESVHFGTERFSR